jgi:tetratricopeptide (TPR) repeat protein
MRIHFSALCIVLFFCVRANAASTITWLQVTTPHFTVISDAGEKQARHIAGQFERMHAVFQKLLPGAKSAPDSPIIVLAVKNRRDFQTLVPASYLSKGSLDLAGLFLESNYRNYILVRLDTEGEHPYSTVYHEYTHYITRHLDLPIWLNEGIAEFYQNTDIDTHQIRFGQPDANDIQLLRSQSLLPLPTLFDVDHNSPYYHEEQKGTMFYAEAWALTYMLYLNDFNNETKLIPNYIRALSSGQTSQAAAVTAFGDLKKLQGGLSNLIGQSGFHLFTLAMDIPNDEASYKVTPMAATDADAYRAAILVSNDRMDDAQKLIDSVLAVDPKNALAYESEGLLHLRDHDLDAARKSYTEAAALHSTSFLTWYYASVLTLRSGEHDDPSIETNLQQSLKLNPDFAPANNALSDYYTSGHKNLDQALTLSILAVMEEPDNIEYRINNASLHMQRNEIPSAIAVLEAARPFARTPAEVAILNARIDQIHRYQDQPAAAVANPVTTATTITTVSDARTVTTAPADDDPHYPDAPPSGPHHTATGILHNVQCAYPTILTLTVDGGAKPVALYTNHVYKIDYWVTFYPKGGLDPCKIEGMKGVVTYTLVKDPRVAGQIVSIRVSK